MKNATIDDILRERASGCGDRGFIEFPDTGRSLTFGELDLMTSAAGDFLEKAGVSAGSNIAVLMRNGEEMALALMGIMRAGFTAVPLNPADSMRHIRFILNRTQASAVFTLKEFGKTVTEAAAGMAKAPHLVITDAGKGAWSGRPAKNKTVRLKDTDTAMILYTSGSTGDPKGVVLTHRNLILNSSYVEKAHGLGAEDRALCVLPLYHINGFVFTLLTPLRTGGSVVMPHKFSVSGFWKTISEYKATWASVVPTILSFLIHHHEYSPSDAAYDRPRLRFVRSASMMLPAEVKRKFEKYFGVKVINTLGLTESAGQVFAMPLDAASGKESSVGVPWGLDVKVSDGRGEAAAGKEGEILIKGGSIMSGYYGEPLVTAGSFSDGWFKTGDMGYRDKDGYYFVTGRKKEIIIRGGENISPLEIDDVLYSHPAVREAAACGVPDPVYGEEVAAFVVLKKPDSCPAGELLEFCRQRLPEYKRPKTITVAAKLPKGPSGKILRKKLIAEAPAPAKNRIKKGVLHG